MFIKSPLITQLKTKVTQTYSKIKIISPKQKLLTSLFVITLVIPIAFFLFNKLKPTSASWLDEQWLYRKELVFNNSAQTSNLTNFPVLVTLSSSNFNFTQAQSSGQDIRFTDSDGVTLLDYEFEIYDATNQTAKIWVNVPQIDASSADDSIYIYWGNATVSDAQDADGTWNSNYKAVYHLNDNAATTTVTDSSGNVNNITASENTNNGFYQSGGEIGGSVLTTGTPTYIPNPYGTDLIELYPDVAVDTNGYPVIAYFDATNSDLVVVHCNDRECKGNNESVSVVDSANSTGYYPSILLDASGYPMIAYLYNTGGDLKYVHCNDANCTGGDETFSTIDSTNTVGYYPRMVLDASGYPVIVYYYPSGTDMKIVHCGNANCNSGNTINTVDGTVTTVGNNLHGSDIVLDSSGYPVISYYDTTNTELKVAHCNDVNCSGGNESLTSPLSSLGLSIGQTTAIELDGSGYPMISYYNTTNANLEYVHCDDVNCAGDESANRVILDTGNSTQSPSLEKNGSGYPVIVASRNTTYPMAYVCANTNCSSSTSTYLTLYNQYGGSSPNLRFDSNYNLVVVAYNRGKTNNYDSVLYVTRHKLERAYDADFNFGTSSFSVSAWFKSNGYANQNYLLSRYDADQGFKIYTNYAGRPCFGIDDDATWNPDDVACSSSSTIVNNVDNGNAGTANWQAMVLDSSGYPVIAYFDDATDDLEIIHCNDANCSGGNENFSSLDTTGDVGRSPSIVLDATGYPVIVYHDNTNNDLKVIHCGNANCTVSNVISTVDSTNDVGDYPTIKLDSSGYPVIAYYDNTNTAVKLAHCNDATCSGGNESIVTLVNDEDDRVRHGSESLQLDSSGYPMVVYSDITNGDLKYIHCNDANCDGVGETKTTIETTNSVGDFASMAKDSSGYPVIAHYDASNLKLRVVHCGNVDCNSGNSINAVNSINSGDAGYYGIDVEMNNSGYPVIIYTSLANWSTVLTVCNDVNCAGSNETNSIIRDDSYNYLYHALEIDSNSYPVISHSGGGWDLRLIHLDNATTYTETGDYDDNTWHHLVAVKNGTSSITIYLDGVSAGSDASLAATGTLTSDSATLNLAEDINNSLSHYNWTGYLDEVQIDTTARSADWAKAQYLSESNTFITFGTEEVEGNPVAYWKFDEGVDNTCTGKANDACDSGTATNDGANSGATWKTEDMCINGKCLYFDGSDDYVDIGDPSDNSLDFGTGDFSVSLWARINSPQSTSYPVMLFKGGWGGTTQAGYNLFYNNTDGNLTWRTKYASAGSEVSSTYSLTNNNFLDRWIHIGAVVDRDGNQTLYVNGNQVDQDSVAAYSSVNISNSISMLIGKMNSGYQVKGFLDEVKIYPYARSINQIKLDYIRGASASGSAAVLGVQSTELLNQGLVGYWKMDEPTANSCSGGVNDSCDSSGTVNDGAWGGNATATAGNYGYGVTFDGTDDYVEITDSGTNALDITSAFTFSVWLNRSGTNGQIFNKETSYEWKVDSSGDINWAFYTNGTWEWHDTNVNVFASTWTHIVLTYDGADVRVYKNGELGNVTADPDGGPLGTNDSNLCLGNRGGDGCTGAEDYNGKLDEVRIYNRTLSPAEASYLYTWGPKPVGYWNLDENSGTTNVSDISTNGNNGTMNGSMTSSDWIPGKYGSALEMDGSNDNISVADNNLLDFSAERSFTLEAWIKHPTISSSVDTIIGKMNSETVSGGYALYMESDGDITIGIDDDELSFPEDSATSTAATYDDDLWHHVAGVKNGNTDLKLYIDGVLIATDATISSVNSLANSDILYLGNDAVTRASAPYWQGVIDEVRIYNYARSGKQIVEDMNGSHPTGGSPIGSQAGYWKFDEGYGTTVYDSSPIKNNGTFGSSPRTPAWTNSGKFGKAVDFDASTSANGDIINFSDSTAYQATTGLTLSAWVYPDTSTGQTEWIIARAIGISPWDDYRLVRSNAGAFSFGVRLASGLVSASTSNSLISVNTWYHVAGTYDSTTGNVYIYVNGQLKGSSSGSGNIQVSSTKLKIGCWTTSNDACDSTTPFNGPIDEVKIYSSALTSDEIKLDYNQGKSTVLGSTSTDSSGNPTWSSLNEYCPPGQTTSCTAPIAEWKIDENTGTTTTYDTSGNGNDGTLNGSMTTSDWVPGKYGSALELDGSNDSINPALEGNFDFGTGSFSLSGWFKHDEIKDAGIDDLVTKVCYGGICAGEGGYGVYLAANGNLCFGIDDDNASFPEDSACGGDYDDNNWHYFAAVKNGTSSVIIYVDGVRIGSDATISATGTLSNNVSFYIGRNALTTTTQYWAGVVDHIRVYNYARSQDQVAWEHNQGGPMTWWKFDECQGINAYDSSGHAKNGSITIGGSGGNTSTGTCNSEIATEAWNNGTDGRWSASLDYDGTDDYTSVADDDIFSFGNGTSDQPFSISAWVYMHDATNFKILAKGVNAANSEYILANNASDILIFRIYDASASAYIGRSYGTEVTSYENSWVHLVATYDGKGVSSGAVIYINGIRVDNQDSQSGSYTAMENLGSAVYIGRQGSDYSNGKIDDVKLFNYELNEEQIKTLYNQGAINFGNN